MSFVFSDKYYAESQDYLSVYIRKNVKVKSEIFDIYSQALTFPDYFGRNWDAFDECLADLSWLKKTKIVLCHYDLPFMNDENEQKTYLSILKNFASNNNPHDFLIVFPPGFENFVLASSASD